MRKYLEASDCTTLIFTNKHLILKILFLPVMEDLRLKYDQISLKKVMLAWLSIPLCILKVLVSNLKPNTVISGEMFCGFTQLSQIRRPIFSTFIQFIVAVTPTFDV
jgi:hypothetical protein